MKIKVTVNGREKEWEIAPDDYLAEVLRREGYFGVKKGCETESCGLCTVHVNDIAVLSCGTLAAKADGKSVTTIEGVGEKAERVREALAKRGVDQCGFCSPGTIMSILYLEKVVTNPTEEEILRYLKGNFCRCSGYVGQLEAVKSYLEGQKHEVCQ
ncbi:(2Fe-2S)-binding protein [Isachenkonia alkalipeptolytica]|uniref:2Fe-2S iron-sulfur cluster binding domain-containing protein n=1 Tax=Isachenkonia alkalipeptolytica TaxID=2565777 RepID=A0AA43XKR4_9CLOT|nr:2Fe-2S iron-sulfur cluster-binding protein [Isachenkonia alkalipeptolytica]NBG88628.1 2Fe-2S iron-sulfur cluster binding domain-containing protein [Isachenkonia alkalipeptolytica]